MDSDLDPNAFLKSVRELKEKRQKEDNERYEHLEAQIIHDRELRQARKLERERSLSPEKTTPQSSRFASREGTPARASPMSASPSRQRSSTPSRPQSSSMQQSPSRHQSPSRQQSPARSTIGSREGRESPAPLDNPTPTSPSKASPSGGLSRSGTLSWQNKRPNSLSVRSRPLSAVASENNAARSPHRAPETNTSEDRSEEPASREKVAQALGSKDPAWFRQTADRGLGSPAYRSSREDVIEEAGIAKKQLPGMARPVSSGTDKDVTSQSAQSSEEPRPTSSPSRGSSVRSSVQWSSSSRPLSMASISEQRKSEDKSPLPALESQRFAAPTRERSSTADGEPPVIGRTMSNAQTRLASDRPVSPTKGMGGFVQSAFMKRTDSVNKRWSATPGPSLNRQDSTASIPSRFGSVRDSTSSMAASRSMPRLDQASTGAESESRPGSSHSTISNLALGLDAEQKDVFAKPVLPSHSHSRSRSVASISHPADGLTSPPLSPSKRWSRSPTKASWLESALARPESPKPVQQSQPSWMAEISKAKQQRNSGEPTLSQDNLDAGKAQAVPKSSTLPNSDILGQSVLKRASQKDLGTANASPRNVTPPTKAKPSSLVGRPTSIEQAPDDTEMPKESEEPTSSTEPAIKEDIVKEDTDKMSSPPAKRATLSSPFMSPSLESKEAPLSRPLSSSKASPVTSPQMKPDTPPKKDFRSGLKSRSDLGGAPKKDEPEFKAMFGKLKKAQTEKYVAPDELKNNIMRGKRGLSISAGPQKSERRDELKESLLKKKEEMRTKVVEPGLPDQRQGPAPAAAVPEALKIKKQLGRSNSSLNVAVPERQRRDVTPEALSLHKALRNKQRAPSPEKSSAAAEKSEAKVASSNSASLESSTKLLSKADALREVNPPSPIKSLKTETGKASAEEKAGVSPPKPLFSKPETKPFPAKVALKPVTGRAESKPSSVSSDPKPLFSKSETKSQEKAESSSITAKAEPEAEIKTASSKLANRFNPALAGILARGPPSQSASPTSGSPISAGPQFTSSTSDKPSGGAELTHMTKNRAKGPKRRKPNTKTTTADSTPAERVSSIKSIESANDQASTPQSATPSKRVSSIKSSKSLEGQLNSPQAVAPMQPRPKSASVRAASLRLSSGQFSTQSSSAIESLVDEKTSTRSGSPSAETPPKPILPPSLPRKPSSSLRQQSVGSMKGFDNGRPSLQTPERKPSLPAMTSPNSMDDDKENSGASVKNVAAMWGRSQAQTQRVPSQRSSPIQLPTQRDEEAAMRSAGLLSNSPLRYNVTPPTGLGISESPLPDIPKKSFSSERSQSTLSSAGLPPKPPVKSSRAVSASLSSKDLPSAPDFQTSDAGRCLADYFGDIPFSSDSTRVDTQSILTARPGEGGRIKTLRKSIQEVSADGKLISLPAQEEHILYEESMYICTHVFGSANGARTTEVYLWAGAPVTESAIQDAQVVARQIAKEAGAGQKSTQLFVVDQNREPPAFFEALGGIIIVRRGSRTERSTSPYMLCGRPHMGHVAFDEVDLSKASLCSDFPYIIARPVTLQETRVYLWKGSTCGPEAVGMARLIGMDLNPSGEIIEVEEGQEPQDLFLLMSDLRSSICTSPELWSKTKNRWDHSTARLFRVNASSPKLGAGGLFTSLLGRRPSWHAAKPAAERPSSVLSLAAPEPDIAVKEISPFTQLDLEPEGCFVMDCGSSILVLPGPLLAKQQYYQQAFTQALLFAHDYVILSASMEDRPAMPTAAVVLAGLPRDAQLRFRRWDIGRGAWGTGGMMAGRRMDVYEDSKLLDIREALELCCKN